MLLPFVTTLLIVNYVLLEKAAGSTVYDASVNSNSDLLTHPRITENCRHVFEGNEGTAIQGFKLRQVFVATTPGLLTPHISNSQSSSYEPDEYVRFCSFRDFLKSGIADYLKTLTIKEKFRGNVIKPDFKIFYSMPDEENCQKQILSLFGLSQLINLGKYLLKSYNDKLVSLDTVQPHPGLAVTYGDETFFHSLSALLYGLLTEKQFIYTHIKKSSYDFSEEAQLQNTYQDLHYFMEQSYIKEYHLFKNSKVNPDDVANPLLFDPNESSKSAISHLSNSLCPTFSDHSSQTVTVTHQDVDNIFNASDLHNIYLTNSLVSNVFHRSYIRTPAVS
uniref:Uncharacterized protein n=1 Tax=Arion vulgaris TaxID=1028688 RepID=A0A0B7ABA5_9EUPU